RMGRANHVGVWIAGGILHCQRGAGMVYDRPDAIRTMGWQMRYWTPGPRRRGRAAADATRALYVPGLDLLMDHGAAPEALLEAHRAVPVAARPGDTVQDVLRRAGLESETVAVFLRDGDDAQVPAWPDSDDPDALEDVLRVLGAVRPQDYATARVAEGQRLVITQVPQGGGGSNPLRLVLQIAVLAAAAFFAPALGPGIASALGIGTEAAGALAFGALNLAGGLVVNAILPPPGPPALSDFSEEVSPTFATRAQSSIARPGAPIPFQLGRHIHQLDDVSPPFVRFESNAQVIYQLLALGVGEHALEEVRLGNVTAWRDGALTGNLPGVSVEHVTSGQPVTLMEEAVFTQGDVTGLTLSPQETVGWHTASPAGQTVVALEIDIAFRQLVEIDNNGNNQDRTVEILVESQMIDDDDQPLGAPVALETLTFTGATRSALRSSHKWFVTQGRYRMRLTRQTAAGDDQTFDDGVWAGLKGILPGGRVWPGIELLAVRVEVGEEFAGQSARQVRAVKTRKLPVWDGTAWTAPQPTREIAWAVAEIARSHDRLGDIDMDELSALHATWSARGDRFDTVIDQRMSFWEVLQAALRAGRAQP
ncbi:host specificity factor TipJ family phage tail protein, partial [Roseovarius ramblicola]